MAEAGGTDPDAVSVAHANVTRFADWLRVTGRGDYCDYAGLWQASVSDVGWAAITSSRPGWSSPVRSRYAA